jgi:ankyrin repeat protein
MLEVAKKMPSDPNSIYSRTMDQINLQPKPQARLANRILTWLTCASETLTSPELVEALAIEEQSREIDPLNKPSTTMLTKVCRGLVIINESNDTIQLAHRTLQDYLMSLYDKDIGQIHNDICSACLTYLSFNEFQRGPCKTAALFRHRRINNVFQKYAALHMGHHFFWSSGRGVLLERMYQFITCKPLSQSYIQSQNYFTRLQGIPFLFLLNVVFTVEGATELHVAATIEDSELLELVLTRSPHLINKADQSGKTALAVAVERGCEEVVRSLLGAGAKTQPTSGESFLNSAARRRYDDIVELLLSYPSQQDPTGSESQTSPQERQLLVGAIKGDQDLVKQVLDLGTNPDARDTDGGTALQWAAWYGYDEIVLILLNHGADVNAVDGTSGRRALHEAAEHGNYSTVELLLENAADVDAKDRWEWTPLHRAAYQGGPEVADVLLRHAANINLKTYKKETALDIACGRGQLQTIRVILHHLGHILPDNFDIDNIEFRGVPIATRSEIYKILLDHPSQTVNAYKKRPATPNVPTSETDEESWKSATSEDDLES